MIASKRELPIARELPVVPYDMSAAQYIPIADVQQSLIERTDHSTYCPFKGRASYYNIPTCGSRSENGIWTYETPYEAVGQIKDHVAFYPNAVDSIEITTN